MHSSLLQLPESSWHASNALAFAVRAPIPVRPGHVIVALRRSVPSYSDTSAAERAALWALVDALWATATDLTATWIEDYARRVRQLPRPLPAGEVDPESLEPPSRPRRRSLLSTFRVSLPTSPSMVRRFCCWRATTAARVRAPKRPSVSSGRGTTRLALRGTGAGARQPVMRCRKDGPAHSPLPAHRQVTRAYSIHSEPGIPSTPERFLAEVALASRSSPAYSQGTKGMYRRRIWTTEVPGKRAIQVERKARGAESDLIAPLDTNEDRIGIVCRLKRGVGPFFVGE